MLPRYNSKLSFETALISPYQCSYRMYIVGPISPIDGEPFVYVSNGVKKKKMFYDRLLRINRHGIIDKCKKIKIPEDDIKKLINIININYEVICKCWNRKMGTGMLEIGENFIWDW